MAAIICAADEAQAAALRAALVDAGCDDIASEPTLDAVAAALVRDRDAIRMIAVDVDHDARPLDAIAALARRGRGTPIVAIADDADLAAAFDAGATEAIAKPLRAGDLRARVANVLRVRNEAERRAARDRRLSESMTKLQRENHELERLVCVDSLTGIANRRHVLALLAAECKRAARDRAPLSLAMIDLDFFHAFNEQYGHPGGDACLQRVVEAMAGCLRRPSDVMGRYGGEEFVVVLPATNAVGARIVAERLRAAVAQTAILHAASPCARVVTASVGFATWNGHGERAPGALVASADAALLRAKLAGRNRVVGEAPPPGLPSRTSPQPWARFSPVIADPWFADRIPSFLDAARGELAQLAAGSLDGAGLIARRLAARAREYGFDQLRRLAGDLEHAARTCDGARARDVAAEIVEYVDHVQVVYRRRPVEDVISI